jgi:hypothetical protein
MRTDQTKKKRKVVAHGDNFSITNCRKKSPPYFQGYLEFFALLEHWYLFVG